jgi:hypothetical protein
LFHEQRDVAGGLRGSSDLPTLAHVDPQRNDPRPVECDDGVKCEQIPGCGVHPPRTPVEQRLHEGAAHAPVQAGRERHGLLHAQPPRVRAGAAREAGP